MDLLRISWQMVLLLSHDTTKQQSPLANGGALRKQVSLRSILFLAQNMTTRRNETTTGLPALDAEEANSNQQQPPNNNVPSLPDETASHAAFANRLSSSLAHIARQEETGDSSSLSSDVRAAVVTGTTTATTGDEEGTSHHSSSGDDRKRAAVSTTMSSERHHSHHFHHHNNHDADEYGLPHPRDDPVRSDSDTPHATVVAHASPPPGGSSSGSGGEEGPGFHTIKRTFNLVYKRRATESNKSSETDSGGDKPTRRKHGGVKRAPTETAVLEPTPRKRSKHGKTRSGSDDDAGGNGSSSGSGTEGGYAGSASSNANAPQDGSYTSPSVSSSDDQVIGRAKIAAAGDDAKRPLLSKKQSEMSMSSEIADFSSGTSGMDAQIETDDFNESSEESTSITSSSNGGSSDDDQDDNMFKKKRTTWPPVSLHVPTSAVTAAPSGVRKADSKPTAKSLKSELEGHSQLLTSHAAPSSNKNRPALLSVGCDVIAHVLTFLEPPEILDVLTMPLSKDWLRTFTRQSELWRVLCLVEPFKAHVEDEDSDSDASSSFTTDYEAESKRTFGKFRLLYSSFVQCMRYLDRIKDDTAHGRVPQAATAIPRASNNAKTARDPNLQAFLVRARNIGIEGAAGPQPGAMAGVARAINIADDGSSSSCSDKKRKRKGSDKLSSKKPRYGHSKLTSRLLGPSAAGDPGDMALPWSCAVYSIVNWMVAFSDVEGIQIMCLKVLPLLLEDEQQRVTAQQAGLTEIVLRDMVTFPESARLHTAAFHTMVLLARPLGGHEGMLFHSSMVNTAGFFTLAQDGTPTRKNGITVMLDSMRCFEADGVLQAMSCWSLVNIALVPAQKEILVRLGGIDATVNAMTAHPFNAEVQFRALFALINLVIPSVNTAGRQEGQADESRLVEELSGQTILSGIVDKVVQLVVNAMKNFCSSEAILNRACLVLHNLSLSDAYHSALLWTPNCYQMLEWCLTNYRNDQVLQQSAAGTLHRLQLTLSRDENLRSRFVASLRSQQQQSLEQAHREAIDLHERHLQQQQQQQPAQQ